MKKAPFFWSLLGLVTIAHILAIGYYTFSASTYYVERLYPNFPTSAWIVYIMLFQLGGIILLWKWYRVGFNIIAGGVSLYGLISTILLIQDVGFKSAFFSQNSLIIIVEVTVLLILYAAMQPIWDSFKTDDVSSRTTFAMLLLLIGVSSGTLLVLKSYGIMLMLRTPSAEFSLGAIFWGYVLLVLQIIGVLSLWKTRERGFLFILSAAVAGTILAGFFDITTASLWDSIITIIIPTLLMFEPIIEKIKKRN